MVILPNTAQKQETNNNWNDISMVKHNNNNEHSTINDFTDAAQQA